MSTVEIAINNLLRYQILLVFYSNWRKSKRLKGKHCLARISLFYIINWSYIYIIIQYIFFHSQLLPVIDFIQTAASHILSHGDGIYKAPEAILVEPAAEPLSELLKYKLLSLTLSSIDVYIREANTLLKLQVCVCLSYVSVHLCLCVCVCICMYVCMYVCMYMCVCM